MSKKKVFEMPYLGIDREDDAMHILYGTKGEASAIIQITNAVVQYSADPSDYTDFHQTFLNAVKILGEGYFIQKMDILSKSVYQGGDSREYLQKKYDDHFRGRIHGTITTYLAITRQPPRSLYTYSKKTAEEYRQHVSKVVQLLDTNGFGPKLLRGQQIEALIDRTVAMDFRSQNIVMDNIKPSDTGIRIGNRTVACLSLIDIDRIDLPAQVTPYVERNDKEALKGFPVDTMAFLHEVPGYDTIIYNQVIEIPRQVPTIQKLEVKKKRHSGIPDPANDICVQDIDRLLTDVARENQLLVNAHFNIVVCAPEEHLKKALNYMENALFAQGIIPSRNAYNQLELFRTAMPGNAVELKHYDMYLTTADAAVTFFFKEALPVSEPSPNGFFIRFTDRQGIPIKIDPADHPMQTGRINNRNKFVLGPSGSGKSFFMNALIEQYLLYNMDVVIVDTGDSYSGTSSYYGGKYITYRPERPITMNPFAMRESEYNLEKKDFLQTLVSLLWKGADGNISQVEADVISDVITAYYASRFGKEANGTGKAEVGSLSFNTFYEFALEKIPEIKERDRIPFDVDEFRFVLKKFYKGGEFDSILNERADESLFDERLIVFEIDNIKENKILFPIVTLIIMDVFLQKMRWRQGQRKALIIEEAWKAIASPMMAGYILYLYKTVRKFMGEAIVVTQELGDIIGNAIVKDSIVNNSDTICLLDQTKFKDNYAQIANLLSINEIERRKIFTINNLDNRDGRGRFKEVYIRRGATGEVYGVEVSLEQYLTYTTEKPEKLAIESYVRRYGSYPEGLEAFVRHMKASGLPLPGFVAMVNGAKEALTDDAMSVFASYRRAHGDGAAARFRNDLADRGMPLSEWAAAKMAEARK